MSYSRAHVVLIAFSVDTPDSLENVTQKVRRVGVWLRLGSGRRAGSPWSISGSGHRFGLGSAWGSG